MAAVVILWARWQVEAHEMGDGRLALPAIEGTHGERLHNGILIRLTETFRSLVLLLALLIVAGRG